METKIETHKSYCIKTFCGTKRGLFFRSPIQKVEFDAYYADYYDINNAWDYLDSIKNPIRRLYEIMIGNKNIVNHINEWSKKDNWGGFKANVICSPIYFKRQSHILEAISTDPNDNIQRIVSYGYEAPRSICAGACHKEITKITLSNGKKLKLKNRHVYKYTYSHVIKEIIDGERRFPCITRNKEIA